MNTKTEIESRLPGHRPGDYIINKYIPNASPEEKEAARENLREYAKVVLRIATRMTQEEREATLEG